MLMHMTLGGKKFNLETAAISCIRYRAKFGDSVINHLAAATTPEEEESVLLRMCWMMIDPAQRPELTELARICRKDSEFVLKATMAKNELFEMDPRRGKEEDAGGSKFDEYQILSSMAALGVDTALIYELPILHLVSIMERIGDLRDPEVKQYRPMTDNEMAQLYPRRKKNGKV